RVGNQQGAGFIVGLVEHVRSALLFEVLGVRYRQKSALMMVEPPGYLGRIRILEVHNYVLVAVEKVPFPGLHRAVGHSREMKIGMSIKPFAIETVEEGGRSGTIKTAVVKAQSYFGHGREIRAFRVIPRLPSPPAKLFKMRGALLKVKYLRTDKKRPPRWRQ